MKVKLSVSRRLTHPKSKKSPTVIPQTVAPSSPTSTTKTETEIREIEAKKIEPEVSKPVEPEVDEPNQSALFGYSKSESSSANLTSVNILVLFVSWFLINPIEDGLGHKL